MADMLGECRTVGGAILSPSSSIEHDDNERRVQVASRSTPSVAGAVFCGSDTATPLSASANSGDVSDALRMPRSSTHSTDGGDIASDITRGAVRRRVDGTFTYTLVNRRPSLSSAAAPAPLMIRRYRATSILTCGHSLYSLPIKCAAHRSMPQRSIIGSHQRQLFSAKDATDGNGRKLNSRYCTKQSRSLIRCT